MISLRTAETRCDKTRGARRLGRPALVNTCTLPACFSVQLNADDDIGNLERRICSVYNVYEHVVPVSLVSLAAFAVLSFRLFFVAFFPCKHRLILISGNLSEGARTPSGSLIFSLSLSLVIFSGVVKTPLRVETFRSLLVSWRYRSF